MVVKVHEIYYGQRGIVGDELDDKTRSDYKELQNNEQSSDILNSIYDIYGHSSAYDLMRQTHSEKPWLETARNDVIKDDLIKEYFEKVFVVEED
ncbi:hypothetical protein [Limosilactobacillus equigenerosi]|uniref:hypothetical protein n=1 Tax=Limosilactobacillus equigenerosi TaxID=417373 RepID=UPI000A846989